MVRRLISFFAIAIALSGCGGGGSSSSALPQAPAGTPVVTGKQNVSVSITVPSVTALAAKLRRPAYVSSQTKSASVSVNGGTPVVANLTAGSPNCKSTAAGLTCTLAINAPVGTDTFNVSLYGQLNGGGSALSRGVASATIAAGQANAVALTLAGVVASLNLTLTPANPPAGSKATIGIALTAKDAAGATIVGGDPYETPISLSDSDSSGATVLSATSIASPTEAAALTLSYTGATLGQAVFSARSGAVGTATATLAPQAPVTIHFNDYVTYGYDNQRSVYNPNSTAITPGNLGKIHLAWQAALGGSDFNTQSQPVLATNVGGHEGILIVGGGKGKVYGYDALNGALLWTRATGQETYTCEGGNTIYFGVGGSAAYDPGSKSLYIVGNNNAGTNSQASNSLFHIDAATGSLLGQVNFAPPEPGWPSLDFSHTSVTLGANGLAYVGTGATCDISSWRGRVAAVSVPSMTLANTFFPVWDPNNTRGDGAQPWGGGGIWGWGGVSLDFYGNVLTGVGNTDNGVTPHGGVFPPFYTSPQENSGLGEAFIRLSPDLSTVQRSHHPIPVSAFTGDSVDLDLQGTPTVFQPNGAGCDPMAAIQAKSGTIYLYDTLRIPAGPVAQYQLAPSSYADGFLGGPTYSPATGLLYVASTSSFDVSAQPGYTPKPGMVAIDPGCGSPSIVWQAAFGPDSYPTGSLKVGTPRGQPAVSAGGVVFVGTNCTPDGNGGCTGSVTASTNRSTLGVARKPLICCAPPGKGGGALWALDASTGTVLNNGSPLIITSGPLRAPPTIDGNWIFVLDYAGNMYGLTIDSHYTAIASTQRTPDARMLRQWEAAPVH